MEQLFVNREAELELIEDSFTALLDKKRLLRTPIIELQGVGGIGKTSLLRKIKQRCHDTQLPYIWVDIRQNSSEFLQEIVEQVKQYTQHDPGPSATYATKTLLEQGPVVMFFDSLETASTEQLGTLETLLRDLIDDEKLFVMLASQRALKFQRERSVARKLKTLSLKPIDRQSCEYYFDSLDNQIDPDVRKLIFDWTQGYPLAMNVMAQAVENGCDPRTPEGKEAILGQLLDQVINQEVLGNTSANARIRYMLALQLFSVPRRFNLVMMQDLIEKFAPELKRESSLAYFSLPQEITEATHVLSWSMFRAGFTVDTPVRNIFLLLLKHQSSERYFAIHEFLAQTNLKLAGNVPGSDRVRYVRESLYHIASNSQTINQQDQLEQALQIIMKEQPENFLEFSLEFSQDEELKEALGPHLPFIEALITAHLKTIDQLHIEEG